MNENIGDLVSKLVQFTPGQILIAIRNEDGTYQTLQNTLAQGQTQHVHKDEHGQIHVQTYASQGQVQTPLANPILPAQPIVNPQPSEQPQTPATIWTPPGPGAYREIPLTYSAWKAGNVPIRKDDEHFFPGLREQFLLLIDFWRLERTVPAHRTGAPKDAIDGSNQGTYFRTIDYNNANPELQDVIDEQYSERNLLSRFFRTRKIKPEDSVKVTYVGNEPTHTYRVEQ